MARLPYGGFDADEYDRDVHDTDPSKAWTKLKTVREHLEDGDPIPVELARWLGDAIAGAAIMAEMNKKAASVEFTRRLGLTVGRGGADSQDSRWHVYGYMMDALCVDSVDSVEAAKVDTHAQMAKDGHEPVGDTQLLKWRDKYRRVRSDRSNAL